MKKLNIPFVLILFIFFVTQTHSHPYQPELRWRHKVAPSLLALPDGEHADFFLEMAERADLSAAGALSTKNEKGRYVYETLTAHANISQAAIVAELDALGVPYRQFWINNSILLHADRATMAYFAARSEIVAVTANPKVALDIPALLAAPSSKNSAMVTIESNIAQINAPEVWELGYSGKGVVIGGQDTGYNWRHPALLGQYRGWDGATASHDYNWHDAIKSGGNAVCGSDSPEPCDDISSTHGTHTMGTAVGRDGDGFNQIGVAPGARWIGCRNMNQGYGTPATYTECYEWFIAPYPIGGDPMSDGDPSKAPHIITNSWGCPPSEGCSEMTLQSVVQAVRAAGIVTVHSAGNDGPGCGTATTPAAHFEESFSVGSVNGMDLASPFSSRGPALVDGEQVRKPNVAAPGHYIRSASQMESYSVLSGTSMAAPHVAGVIALLISAEPALAGQVDQIEQILTATAAPLTTSQGCGGDTPDAVPNNVYGHGRVDALAAVSNVLPKKFDTYLPTVIDLSPDS